MTLLTTTAGSLLAAGALALGGLLGAGSDGRADQRQASLGLVIDAAAARHGRDLLDPRLRSAGADVRLPRTAQEARTDLRYLVASGDAALVVVGPRAAAAARETGIRARRAADVAHALRAIRR
jgi:hypothetical protein